MDENEARERIADYLRDMENEKSHQFPSSWLREPPAVLCHLPRGDWVATLPGRAHEGILLKSDGTIVPFFGALGKMVPLLGWLPVSREYFLGSAFHGRYQVYEEGLAVWEELQGGGNTGYPISRWNSLDGRARSCSALIGFFDLRGFTNWSAQQEPKQVQDTIELLEQSFQEAFSSSWCKQLFAKGTGDGLMVVSEAGRYEAGQHAASAEFQSGHAGAFCLACAETVRQAAQAIPEELAVGCGVTLGKVIQLYLLGRFDYIGPGVNDASKIQTIAYGELCLSEEVLRLLQIDGVEVHGKKIPGKGIRVDAADLIQVTARPDA